MTDLLRSHFEAVLKQMPAGVVVMDGRSGRALLGNEQLAAIWRQPFRGVEGVEWFTSRRGFHPDGRPYRPEDWPAARTLASGEVVEGEEIEIERGDGTRGTIRTSAIPVLNESGEMVAVVATSYDITEEKRQESARRLLSEVSSVLAGSLEYEETLRNVARLAVPTLSDWCLIDVLRDDGRVDRLAVEHPQPEKARLAREVSRRFPMDPNGAAGIPRVLRTGTPELVETVTDELLRAVASDEEHLRLLRAASFRSAMLLPLRARGRAIGAMVFATAESGRIYGPGDLEFAGEVADRVALALDHALLYQEAQVANRAKSDFLAVVSHELRTPLTAIIGYAELLDLGVPDPVTDRQREQVERISASAAHLLMIIEEILTVISLEAGDLRLRATKFPLAEILERADLVLRPIAEAKGLSLHLPSPDLEMETDSDRLLQVLLNLLANAIKFTETGEVRLTVALDGDVVQLSVDDSGVGVKAEDLPRVFDPFWQAEEPITRKSGGAGLGLTITRGLVERLGGSIQARSTPARGSTFTVRIPLQLPFESAGRARS